MSQLPETPQLNRDYARLLLVMRKLIRNEFEVSLPLDRPETTVLLLHYAQRSQESLLHEMAKELEELLAQPAAQSHGEELHEVARYRGAVAAAPLAQEMVQHDEPVRYRGVVKHEDEAASAPHEGQKAKRIYRGQVVEE